MHAEILQKDKYEEWVEFAQKHPYSSIHQTFRWGRFQANMPSRDKFWILVLYERKNGKQQITAGTILIKHKLPKGDYSWLYSPRGPLLKYEDPHEAKQQMKVLLKTIKTIAKQENAVFYRADPLLETHGHGHGHKKQIHFPGFHKTKLGFQPNTTLILDIAKSEDEILKQMKPKGRYNIRLADKKGVEIMEVTPPTLKDSVDSSQKFAKQIKKYYQILQETLERDKFYGHSITFYKSLVEKLSLKTTRKGFARMYLAQYKEPGKQKIKYIAGVIVTFYKDTAIYYYGASGNQDRNVMAPYLLQWHAIKEAKKLKCTKYDMLGISPQTRKSPHGSPDHPWHGVTEFKRKFGGQVISYQYPQEHAFKPFLYYTYKVIKHFRQFVRRFKG